VRVEIDPEKLYPQIDYSNDIAPREFTENDLLAEISAPLIVRSFQKPNLQHARFYKIFGIWMKREPGSGVPW
jgi:hypothetical protein